MKLWECNDFGSKWRDKVSQTNQSRPSTYKTMVRSLDFILNIMRSTGRFQIGMTFCDHNVKRYVYVYFESCRNHDYLHSNIHLLKIRIFFYITTMPLSYLRKLILVPQYHIIYHLIYNLYSNFLRLSPNYFWAVFIKLRVNQGSYILFGCMSLPFFLI